jgi:predicted enzyme related to lactoylglutathione lyase
MRHVITWFEIPVLDIGRAAKFYGAILDASLQVEQMEGGAAASLPSGGGIGGCLFQGVGYVPSADGAVLYLYGGDDLNQVLERVEPAGGQVVTPKTGAGDNGFFAYFLDTEGNRIGLHSMR